MMKNLRDVLLRKNVFLDFVQITHPSPSLPQLIQLVQELKVSLGPKMHFLKMCQKIWAGLPLPPYLGKIQKKVFFSQEDVSYGTSELIG